MASEKRSVRIGAVITLSRLNRVPCVSIRSRCRATRPFGLACCFSRTVQSRPIRRLPVRLSTVLHAVVCHEALQRCTEKLCPGTQARQSLFCFEVPGRIDDAPFVITERAFSRKFSRLRGGVSELSEVLGGCRRGGSLRTTGGQAEDLMRPHLNPELAGGIAPCADRIGPLRGMAVMTFTLRDGSDEQPTHSALTSGDGTCHLHPFYILGFQRPVVLPRPDSIDVPQCHTAKSARSN